MLKGMTFSGGEPFLPAGTSGGIGQTGARDGERCDCVQRLTYEQLSEKHDPQVDVLLQETDVLIDGLSWRSKNLNWYFAAAKTRG